MAEPYGRAFAASAIFLTDATTGKTRIWRVPERTSLSGNRRALQAVRAVSIPGIDYGDGAPGATGSGNFRVVEPRPVFVKGHLVYLTSIVPKELNAVSKTVVVDAETNKLVAIFTTTAIRSRSRRRCSPIDSARCRRKRSRPTAPTRRTRARTLAGHGHGHGLLRTRRRGRRARHRGSVEKLLDNVIAPSASCCGSRGCARTYSRAVGRPPVSRSDHRKLSQHSRHRLSHGDRSLVAAGGVTGAYIRIASPFNPVRPLGPY